MSDYFIYVIYNKVEDSFSPLDVAGNDTVAKRRFKIALSSDKVVYKNDFELYKLGKLNPVTYEIEGLEKELVCTYADLEKDTNV